MTTTRYKRMTLEEFLALPERKPALEFEDGEVCQKVSPLGRHSRLQSQGWGLLSNFAEPRRLGMAFTEARTTFAGRSRVPDLCLYSWARIPRTPDGTIEDYFFTPPDIVFEVISPAETVQKLSERCRWYVANGVQIALLVNHFRGTVTRFTPTGEAVLTGDDRIDLDAVLPGFALTVQALFATLKIER